jgi:hypothetical protein
LKLAAIFYLNSLPIKKAKTVPFFKFTLTFISLCYG